MAKKLKNLVITKVALVDEGACSAAHIKLFKRKEGGQDVMNFEEIIKKLPEDQQQIIQAEITKAKEELPEGALSAEEAKKLAEEKAAAELAKTTAMDEVESLKKGKNEPNTEDVLKNADPVIKAAFEKMKAQAAAAEAVAKQILAEKEETEFLAKAKEVNLIPEADKKVVSLLKSIKGVDGAVESVMEILKSANDVIAKGKVFDEVGSGASGSSNGTSADDAWEAIEKAAAKLVVKGQVTQAQAIQRVITEQPELYKSYVTALKGE